MKNSKLLLIIIILLFVLTNKFSKKRKKFEEFSKQDAETYYQNLDELETKVIEIIADHLKIDKDEIMEGFYGPFNELGIGDSLGMDEALMELEDEFDIEFLEDFDHYHSMNVNDIIIKIKKLLN